MKKLISILLLSTLVLSGCGAKSNKIQQPQQQVQDDDNEEIGWFEDEVLDMDDWGETKHKKKVTPKTGVTAPKANVKPSTPPKSSTSNTKSSTTKKK